MKPKRGMVALSKRWAIAMMLAYISLGLVSLAAGSYLLYLNQILHPGGSVALMTVISGVVVALFGLWRILLSLYHLVRIFKKPRKLSS